MPSPALLIPPVTSVSPDWYLFGVSPKWAPTLRDRPNRIVDGRGEGDRHQGADAGHGHQPAADAVVADDAEHGPMQRVELPAQGVARPQHRLDHPLQHRLPGDQVAD